MKEVEKSVYFEEKILMNTSRDERRTLMGKHKIFASPAML